MVFFTSTIVLVLFKFFKINICSEMQDSTQSEHRKKHGKKCRKGGLSDISEDRLASYYSFLTLRRSESSAAEKVWLPSVRHFKQVIDENPVLRMNWEYGIYQCTKTLSGKTGDDVLDMIDTACKTPPSFSNSEFIGFPINALFLEFMQNQNGRNFFSHRRVNKCLRAILNEYTTMLQSKASLEFMNERSPSGWFCKEAKEKIDYDQFICDPEKEHYGFKNWNQWFLREFKPTFREIGVGSPPGAYKDNTIINSCESTPLTLPMQPQYNVKETDHFWLKDDCYSLTDMFGAKRFKKQHLVNHFIGGTVYQAYLSALNYHRWRAPVDGVIEDIYAISGTYYLDQSEFIPYDSSSPNNSESFLSSVAFRKVFVINSTNRNIGKIAIIYIGMTEVSSCISTVNIGDSVFKGQQIGHFAFGGSTHVIIFEKKTKLKFHHGLYNQNNNGEVESLQQNVCSFLAEVETEQQAYNQI